MRGRHGVLFTPRLPHSSRLAEQAKCAMGRSVWDHTRDLGGRAGRNGCLAIKAASLRMGERDDVPMAEALLATGGRGMALIPAARCYMTNLSSTYRALGQKDGRRMQKDIYEWAEGTSMQPTTTRRRRKSYIDTVKSSRSKKMRYLARRARESHDTTLTMRWFTQRRSAKTKAPRSTISRAWGRSGTCAARAWEFAPDRYAEL